jgi:GDPmannose 4,6-dehydratase
MDFMQTEKPDQVYLAAAKVGGIHANNTYPAEFIYENLVVQTNAIHAAHQSGVQKLLFLGSSCIYPREVSQPMKEEALMMGYLEPTNEPYAIAKIAGIKLCESYNRQYGREYRSVMPTNLYGPGDNFHPENSHVIPALLRRFHEAVRQKAPEVVIWGSGAPMREFLHVDDMAAATVHVMNLDHATYQARTRPMMSHINVGSGQDCTIRELAETVAKITGFTGRLTFDASKPDGMPRKLMDVSLLTSLFNTDRIDHLYQDPHEIHRRMILHYGDLTDATNLIRILQQVQPDEVYNLAAQSHVQVSFESPEYTADTDALGTLRLLEGIRLLGLEKKTKFYQASTSELYGKVWETPQTEKTLFYPRSPYGVAKLYAFWITVNYREAYDLFACNGILFNHESPIRGETFVTRKITRALCRIYLGLQDCLYLGNLNARRDWGHARDYVEVQWLMLQQDTPDDYVIATGEQHSVREFVDLCAAELGMTIQWQGMEVDEIGIDAATGKTIVAIDPRYFRPAEVDTLLGDATKARQNLGWTPKITFKELVREMTQYDLAQAKKDELCYRAGFLVYNHRE